MRVQIVNFNLAGIGPEEYAAICDQLAPAFAAMPGLVAKTWLANPATNTYGGVYLWRDQSALDGYLGSDLLRGVMAHPNLKNITSADFDIMEAPSAVTRGLAAAAV
jgi:hypothetical protein